MAPVLAAIRAATHGNVDFHILSEQPRCKEIYKFRAFQAPVAEQRGLEAADDTLFAPFQVFVYKFSPCNVRHGIIQ